MERRFVHFSECPVELEAREEGEAPVITGLASVFFDGTPETEFKIGNNFVERIMPSAFNEALQKDDVRGLFNHGPDNILGRTSAGTMRLSVSKKAKKTKNGLRYEIDPPDTQLGRDVVISIDRGDITGSSFGFTITDERFKKEGDVSVREIHGARLFDVGPVTFPAYEGATTGIRSEDTAEAEEAFNKWESQQAEDKAKISAKSKSRAREIEILQKK